MLSIMSERQRHKEDMKIRLNNIWITGTDMRERPGDLRINGQRVEQDAQFLRAAQARVFDRQNVMTTITFSIAREHASEQDAEYFILTHYADLPGNGTALLIAEDSTGREKNLYLENAVLVVTDHRHMGVSSFHDYTLKGGILTDVKP